MTQHELEDLFGFGIVEIQELLEENNISIDDDKAIIKLAEEIC